MFRSLYNPITFNMEDNLNKEFDSSSRSKYVPGSVIFVEEVIVSPNDSSVKTKSLAEYMWVEAGTTISKGVPGIIVPGSFQTEAVFTDLEAATAGQKIAFSTVNISSGKYTWVKISGHITVAANANVVAGNYVKVNRSSSNVEQGNSTGNAFDEESLGKASTSSSGGEAIVVIPSGRTVKVF